MNKILLLACLLGTLTLEPMRANAVGTNYWRQNNEADFKTGTLDSVVVTNLGDIKLSRAVKTLLEQDSQISSVTSLAEAPDGTIYAGTAPHAALLEVKGEKVSAVATIPDAAAVLSLLVDKSGAIIVGTGGETGKIVKINKPGEAPKTLFQAEGVQYVWAMYQAPDGNLYAATGPTGTLFEIKPDGSHRALLESGQGNLLSMVCDGKDMLFIGTDPRGLIYRVNRKTGESFVLYNAAESEVSALALDKNGNLYAGTSEAKEEGPASPDTSATEEKSGRPEGGSVGVPIPADRPKEPTPPPPPNPNPGQPNPIPKASFRPNRGTGVLPLMSVARRGTGVSPVIDALWNPETQAGRLCYVKQCAVADESPDDGSRPKKKPKPGPGGPVPGPNPKPEPGPQTEPSQPPTHQPTVDTTTGAEPRPEGNAIYKIDPDGFVTEVFRQPVLILSMIENNGTLLVATGGEEGNIYQVRPSAEETTVLAKVDPKEIMCLLAAHDGNVYLGTANTGTIASMSAGYANRGTYESPVLDATQISRFGKIHLHGSLPAGSTLTVATRSGNVKDADEKTWSKWSDEAPAAEFMQVMAPSARFLQYRLTLTAADGKSTPVASDISVAYQVPNLPPRIKSVKIASAGAGSNSDLSSLTGGAGAGDVEPPAPHRVESGRRQTIAWEASDPNNDVLTYSLYIRPIGEQDWILLKDKLTDTVYDWDTRTTADGRYEVKVVASDASSNPPGTGKTASRVSDPITVDNTPPVIGDIKTQQNGADVHIDLKVVDRTSTVAAVDYSVDSNKDWQFVLPTDQIYDSPEETVSFSITGLKPGRHQISLRATDSKGNESFENVFMTVANPQP